MQKTPNGVQGTLHVSSSSPDAFPPDVISELTFRFYYETETRLRLRILDANASRWEVPGIILTQPPPVSPSPLSYSVNILQKPFSFSLSRTPDRSHPLGQNSAIFNTNFPFFYANQFLELSLSTLTNSPHIYGWGERVHSFRLDPTTDIPYVIFNKDEGTPVDLNLYGTHPFFVSYDETSTTGQAFGIFFVNSNAQELAILGKEKRLRYRTIGGVIDMFIFVGPSAKDVVKDYLEVVGRPMMPPLWGMGYHQCRWGYHTLSETKEVVNKFKTNQIPLETIWNDIDYMDGYRDFTADPVRFPLKDFQAFIAELEKNHQHYIHIIDVGIKQEKGYPAYDYGMDKKSFVMKADLTGPIVNKVWPGLSVFPDLWKDNGSYWKYWISEWLGKLNLSGIWVDMNEPSGFCDGSCLPQPSSRYNFDPLNPPYVPGGADLNQHTLSLNSVTSLSVMYNSHNLYGYEESRLTAEALQEKKNERPFVITRSTHAGSGRHVGHWLGDNHAEWADIAYSVSGVLSMAIFGVSTCGADICGFGGNTTEELCSRWMELGSFYPFMRNHNAIGARSQEPYAFGKTLLDASKTSIGLRYGLLPYYYTQMLLAHRDGELAFRSLLFEFGEVPDPHGLLPFIDHQFLIGPSLMVSPVLFQGHTKVYIFVPDDTVWYDYYSGKVLDCKDPMCEVDAPIEFINLHVRGGSILPRKTSQMTVYDTFMTPYNLVVALDETGAAAGYVWIDDGVSLNPLQTKKYTSMTFGASVASGHQLITGTMEDASFSGSDLRIEEVKVYGCVKKPTTVLVNGAVHTSFSWSQENSVLEITSITDVTIAKNFRIEYY